MAQKTQWHRCPVISKWNSTTVRCMIQEPALMTGSSLYLEDEHLSRCRTSLYAILGLKARDATHPRLLCYRLLHWETALSTKKRF